MALKYLWARKKIKLMSDYGVASNETDTISIEEEITLLGLKYSLVTEYTSFVAVDSCASINPENDTGNDDGGGVVSDFHEFIPDINQQKCLNIIGNITQNRLRLRLNELCLNNQIGSLIISDLSGKYLLSIDLSKISDPSLLEIPIDHFTQGLYFVSWLKEGKMISTEKFVKQ